MRIIIQPVTDGFELCARLGLVFAPLKDLSGKAIYAVLRGSPSAKAGLKARDIVFAADKTRLKAPRALNEPVCWNCSSFNHRPSA